MSESSDLVNPGRDYNQPRTQHTPGPWRYFLTPSTVSQWSIVDASEQIVARTPGYEPNARLIAAAPELLAAIKSAKVQRDPRHRVSMLVNDWQRILDAVAKAEGRTDAPTP